MPNEADYWQLKWEFARERRRLIKRKLLVCGCFAMISALLITICFFHVVLGIAMSKESSMVPRFNEGDMVIYRRLHIPFERGELVVFHQEQLGYDCIKRIVAVGGDTVDIPGDGQVYLNGEPLSEPYLYMTSTLPHDGIEYPLSVPEGFLFVMGDNREVSLDSRSQEIGLIRENEVLGYLPSD